jgi:predicted DNA binding CopG/RHH family protein
MLKNYKLTAEEKKLEAEILAGEWKTVKNLKSEIKRYQAIAQNQFKDKMVSFRISSPDIAEFKKKADEVGVPYQTLLSAFVKQYPKGKATLTI